MGTMVTLMIKALMRMREKVEEIHSMLTCLKCPRKGGK